MKNDATANDTLSMTPARSDGGASAATRLWRAFRSLRPEEALFVVGFVASSIVTIYANWQLAESGFFSRRIEGGLTRLAISTLLAATIPLIHRWRERLAARPRLARAAEFYRTMLPFLLCIAVYTNLHDTVRYINPHDVHQYLVAIEEWLFGGQPTVWAQDYITPFRTEVFSAFYSSFFLIAPSTVAMIWLSGKGVAAKHALLGVILCFYSGYLLYLIFPAAPPRLYLDSLGYYTMTLRGRALMTFQNSLIEMMPNHASRAAFPSLHAAVSVVSIYYAWRYARWYVPVLVFVTTGLLVSTVYLRHHYVVDLIAGVLLAPWAIWITPRFERWWQKEPIRCR
jgi:membrane-associated phospholipid phosphatase